MYTNLICHMVCICKYILELFQVENIGQNKVRIFGLPPPLPSQYKWYLSITTLRSVPDQYTIFIPVQGVRMILCVYNIIFLTHGMHAQQGLHYLVSEFILMSAYCL